MAPQQLFSLYNEVINNHIKPVVYRLKAEEADRQCQQLSVTLRAQKVDIRTTACGRLENKKEFWFSKIQDRDTHTKRQTAIS